MDAQTDPAAPTGITTIRCQDRTVHLLGTAHVSAASCAEVETAIRTLRPDAVLVELDTGRLESLRNPEKWRSTDIRQVIRERQLPTLIASLVLGSYQRRMGGATGVRPGSELLRAVDVAEAAGIPVVLCDRPIKTTMRRLWASIGWWQRFNLVTSLVASLFSSKQFSEEDLGKLKQPDTMDVLLRELGAAVPGLARVLVSERDQYMAEGVHAASGGTVLAVVGAAHVPGMAEVLRSGQRIDRADLETIPQPSLIRRVATWGLPALLLAVLIGLVAWKWRTNPTEVFSALRLWIVCTSLPAAAAALVAWAHPLVIALVAALAPFATLLRAIPGPKLSLLGALVQAWLRPPTVADMEQVAEHIAHPTAWWRNRLLRIILVFILPGLASTAGAVWALSLIARGG